MKKLLTASLIAASLTAPAAATAATKNNTATAQQYDFSFVGYYSGLRIAEAHGRLDWGDGRYRLAINAKSDGIVGWFTVIKHHTHSEGAVAAKPQVDKHYYLSSDGNKKTEIELAFSPEDVEIVAAKPHPSKEKRPPVPVEMKRGSLDPLSAVLALGMSANADNGCNGTEQVFDGRRRYDIVLENSRTIQYKGPRTSRDTYVCDFRFIRKGGYREKAKKWKGIVGKVWIQRVADELPMLPVRMEIKTSYGTGYIHMLSAKDRNIPGTKAARR